MDLLINLRVKYSSSIRPACLHVGNQINDNEAIAIGYGMTDSDNRIMSDMLMKVIIKIVYTYVENFKNYKLYFKGQIGQIQI